MNKIQLKVSLTVVNKNKKDSFDFTTALHTYFKVDIKTAIVSGFKGTEYIDSIDNNKVVKEENDKITITCEVDRRYKSVPNNITLFA